ncbi:MAG: FAD-dependent oxidoreductase [Pirellulales bacterium]
MNGELEAKVAKLVARFHELFPGTEFVPEYAWAGTFGESADGLAYIGSPPGRPRVGFAVGYGGNGITFSMIAAGILADAFLGRTNADGEIFRFGR